MYRLHLSSAYGFYNHLILRFQSEFNSILDLTGFLDFPFFNYEKQPIASKILKIVSWSNGMNYYLIEY